MELIIKLVIIVMAFDTGKSILIFFLSNRLKMDREAEGKAWAEKQTLLYCVRVITSDRAHVTKPFNPTYEVCSKHGFLPQLKTHDSRTLAQSFINSSYSAGHFYIGSEIIPSNKVVRADIVPVSVFDV